MKRGFTLIELLVVISIISLLASMSLTSLSGARMKSRNIQRVRSLLEVQKAIELYAANNSGLYPPHTFGPLFGLECWECTPAAGGNFTYDPNKMQSQIGQYLSKRPSDPSLPPGGRFGDGTTTNSRGYWYQTNPTRNQYKLIIYNTVEIPGAIPGETVTVAMMRKAGIPDKITDLVFDPSSSDASISVASSNESKNWVWYQSGGSAGPF